MEAFTCKAVLLPFEWRELQILLEFGSMDQVNKHLHIKWLKTSHLKQTQYFQGLNMVFWLCINRGLFVTREEQVPVN